MPKLNVWINQIPVFSLSTNNKLLTQLTPPSYTVNIQVSLLSNIEKKNSKTICTINNGQNAQTKENKVVQMEGKLRKRS